MEVWLILLFGGLIFFGIFVLVLYDRGHLKQLDRILDWTGMGYDQLKKETVRLAKETHEALDAEQKQTVTYTVQPRKTFWDLLQLFLVPLVLAIVAFAFNAGQASSSQQLEQQSAQEQVLNTYIDQMSNLVLQDHLHDSQLGDPIRAIAQALTLTALSRLDSEHKNIIILFLYRADILKYHYYKNNETDCGDPNVLKKQFHDEQPIITLSQGNLEGVTINNLSLRCIDLHNMILTGSDYSTSELDRADLGLSLATGANFSYASMIAANLFYLDLENAKLQGTKLEYANMEGICLSHALLVGADLRYADLRVHTHAANYETLFCGQHDNSTITPANLSNAVLSQADLTGAVLSQADLTGADLNGANLSGTNLSGANLSSTNLDNTVLKGARYNSQEILVQDSQGNNLIKILPTAWPQGFNPKAAGATENNTLNGANLSGANLSGASLLGADLSGANLSNAKITQAQLKEAKSLKNAIMPDGSKHP